MTFDLATISPGAASNRPRPRAEDSPRHDPPARTRSTPQREHSERPRDQHAAQRQTSRPNSPPARARDQHTTEAKGRQPTPSAAPNGAKEASNADVNKRPFRLLLAEEGPILQPLPAADQGAVPLLAEEDGQAVLVDEDLLAQSELALTLTLPAQLGTEALNNLQLTVTAGQDGGEAKAGELAAAMLLSDEDDNHQLLASLPQLLAEHGQSDDEQVMMEVVIDGEVVTIPVTLQIEQAAQPSALPDQQQVPEGTLPAAQGTAAGGTGEISAASVPVYVPNSGNPNHTPSPTLEPSKNAPVGNLQQATAAETTQAVAAAAEGAAVATQGEKTAADLTANHLGGNQQGSLDIGNLRQVPNAQNATPNAPSQSMLDSDEVDRAVQHQVKRAMVQQLANGDRTLTLRLTPPNLGTIRIEMVEAKGVMTVRFQAEDDSVRQALERQLPQLRQDLRAGDAPVSSLRMEDSTQGWHQGQQQHSQSSGQQRQGADNQTSFSLNDDDYRENAEEAPATTTTTLGGQVSDQAVDARA